MRGIAHQAWNATRPSRVFFSNPNRDRAMTANISIWLRAFRLPLQRTYPRLEERPEEIDADFADLLRRADERTADPRTPDADTCAC